MAPSQKCRQIPAGFRWLLFLGICTWQQALALPAEGSCDAPGVGGARADVEAAVLVQLFDSPQQARLELKRDAGKLARRSTKNHTNTSVGKIEEHIEHSVEGKEDSVVVHRDQPKRQPNASSKGEVNATDDAFFASAKYKKNVTDEELDVRVDIAMPRDIISIYLLLYVPLMMAWTYYYYQFASVPQTHLHLLLIQITFGATTVGSVLANQSLSVLMKAPMALTSVQAFFMFAGAGIAAVVQHLGNKSDSDQPMLSAMEVCQGLYTWSPASVAFLVYQLADHLVSNDCSLSERTVFGNLGPVFSLIGEVCLSTALAPRATDGASASFSSRMALFLTVFGAVLFALQYPDFTWLGVRVSTFFVGAHVIYRMFQRYLVDKVHQIPTTFLVCLDGFVVFIPSLALSVFENTDFWTSWGIWLGNSSIVIMLILSLVTFSTGHYVAILMLKTSTVTLTMVIGNIASSMCVIQGIVFFGDQDFQKPLVFIGILVSIAGGFWYSANQDAAISASSKAG